MWLRGIYFKSKQASSYIASVHVSGAIGAGNIIQDRDFGGGLPAYLSSSSRHRYLNIAGGPRRSLRRHGARLLGPGNSGSVTGCDDANRSDHAGRSAYSKGAAADWSYAQREKAEGLQVRQSGPTAVGDVGGVTNAEQNIGYRSEQSDKLLSMTAHATSYNADLLNALICRVNTVEAAITVIGAKVNEVEADLVKFGGLTDRIEDTRGGRRYEATP